MWALGCILYELLSGSKLFQGDLWTLEYKRSKNLKLPVPWPNFDDPLAVREVTFPVVKAVWVLRQQFKTMLTLEPSDRPSANSVQTSWEEIRQELNSSPGALDDRNVEVYSNSSHLNDRHYRTTREIVRNQMYSSQVPIDIIQLTVVDAHTDSGARRHRKLVLDCWTLVDVLMKPPNVSGLQRVIKILAQCNPFDIELLKFQFYERTNDWLYAVIERHLAQGVVENRIVLTGLALGPVAFDAWLLHRVSSATYPI